MTRVRTILILITLCYAAICQAQYPPPGAAPMAKPSDLSLSCRIDAKTRILDVTIANEASRQVRFLIGGPTIDFEVEITNKRGQRLHQYSNQAPSPNHVWDVSIGTSQLAPKAQYAENVPLGNMVGIPKEGGTFRVRVGRILLPFTDHLRLDPQHMVWCTPIDVTFPASK